MGKQEFDVVIPARYASQRLPGKPLLLVKGKPLIQHVYECAQRSQAKDVYVATDDSRIEQTVLGFGGRVVMTSTKHASGTERLAEVVDNLEFDSNRVVVNLQGDEPLMPAEIINGVANLLLNNAAANMATAAHTIVDNKSINDPNVVKVVLDNNNRALYFSRAPIPFDRDDMGGFTFLKHIGIYAYRVSFIKEYSQWSPCALEQIEKLEQLRVLWKGHNIEVLRSDESPGPGVDTQEDLDAVKKLLE